MKLSHCKVIVILLVMSCKSFADSSDVFNLQRDSLENNIQIFVTGNWEYHPGDNYAWAEPGFDAGDWEKVDGENISRLEFESGWNNIGWFRKWMKVDSSLTGKILGVRIVYIGAYEFYLNGVKIFSAGKPDSNSNSNIALKDFTVRAISFMRPDSNLIAVRYSNHDKEFFDKTGSLQGPSISFGNFDELSSRSLKREDGSVIQFTVLIAIALILAFLHTFLFLFNTKSRSNLFYVLFLLCFAGYIYLYSQFSLGKNEWGVIQIYIRLIPMMLTLNVLLGAMAAYSIFSDLPKIYPYIFTAAVFLGLFGFIVYESWVMYLVYAFIFFISPPTGYKIFCERKDGLGGEWIIRSGFIFMSAAGIYQMLLSFGWVPPLLGIYIVYFYGVLGFIVSMSVLLARDFAVMNINLELQLENVQQLSEKTLKQELEKKELETRKQILEADNYRKTKELEDARKLQLSMLPQKLPDIDGLEIAAYMSTATEVGGDYYDFIESKDGTLNIAIGDATGHGTRAGTMVASIKSLFAALGGSMMIPDFFRRCTEIIKSMKLGNLFMSMIILRLKGNYMIVSSAGMPPIMIYRNDKKRIDEITLKGMPLGAFTEYDYIEHEEELSSGDMIFMFSDGMHELFNSKKEMFGDERIKSVILNSIEKSPQEIIDALVEAGRAWRGDASQEDDITLIAVKIQ